MALRLVHSLRTRAIFFDARSAMDLMVKSQSTQWEVWHLAGPRRENSNASNLPATQWDLRHVLWWAKGLGGDCCEICWHETQPWRWGSFYTGEGSCNWPPQWHHCSAKHGRTWNTTHNANFPHWWCLWRLWRQLCQISKPNCDCKEIENAMQWTRNLQNCND